MGKPKLIPVLAGVVALCFIRALCSAQTTNPLIPIPATKLESFETNNSMLILKSSANIGSISGSTGVVSVRCREITDVASGHKERGIVVGIAERSPAGDTLLIDYDEIAALVNAMDYLGSVQFSVTSLDTFDAQYTTKGGFRVAALGNRLAGRIQFSVRDGRNDLAPVAFSLQDLARLKGFISQAKAKLDSLNDGE
jgi:hypothetical protein